jgi:hypothetical protein
MHIGSMKSGRHTVAETVQHTHGYDENISVCMYVRMYSMLKYDKEVTWSRGSSASIA